ncbi:MAG: hypothetical protein KC425_23630 [Anaerolineales bacterium]|nr:hypothetical protein [Anaerolineales bacterium]
MSASIRGQARLWTRPGIVVATAVFALCLLTLGINGLARAGEAAGEGVAGNGNYARAHQHQDFVDGQFEPNASVLITVTDGGGGLKGTGSGTADGSGWMNGVYAGADILPGDWIHVASSGGFTATLRMITITGRVDLAADLVTGTMAGGSFPARGDVEVHSPITGTGMPISITASGHFTADFSGSFDITQGDEVWAWYADADGNQVGASAFYPFVSLNVNYAHEWVDGRTLPGTAVAITLTDDGGGFKAAALLTADAGGYFGTDCADWSTAPDCPDLAVGDGIVAAAAGITATVDPIGEITGSLDDAANTVSGMLTAPFSGTLAVWCEVWVPNGPPAIQTTADAGGGAYQCDFDDVGWDLAPGQDVAVSYYEPDGDRVINVLTFPWMRVNYAHDVVEGEYPAGHTLWITVTDSMAAVKATAVVTTQPGAGWNGDGFHTDWWQWTPGQPDIVPGDSVAFAADDGYQNVVGVGRLTGIVDLAADTVSGTIGAPGFSQPLGVECHPWGAWENGESADVKASMAAPDGSSGYLCSWAGEWDLVPDRDVAIMYVEPDGDRVINVVQGFASYLPAIRMP